MTDIERIELALRRTLDKHPQERCFTNWHDALTAFAEELGKMRGHPYPGHTKDDKWPSGYKLNWVP